MTLNRGPVLVTPPHSLLKIEGTKADRIPLRSALVLILIIYYEKCGTYTVRIKYTASKRPIRLARMARSMTKWEGG